MQRLPIFKTIKESFLEIHKNLGSFGQIYIAWALISTVLYLFSLTMPAPMPITLTAAVYIVMAYLLRALLIFPFFIAIVSIIDTGNYTRFLGIFPAVSFARIHANRQPLLVILGLMLMFAFTACLLTIPGSMMMTTTIPIENNPPLMNMIIVISLIGIALMAVQFYIDMRLAPLYAAIACNDPKPISTSWKITKGNIGKLFAIISMGSIIGFFPATVAELLFNNDPTKFQIGIINFFSPADIFIATVIVTASLKLLRAEKPV